MVSKNSASSDKNSLPADMLDVFSPLKRKVDSTDDVERNEKRLKETTNKLEKSTRGVSKRFSAVVDPDGKKERVLRPKPVDAMRVKERAMEKEAIKALTSKNASGISLHGD
jgi:hypothetical protein